MINKVALLFMVFVFFIYSFLPGRLTMRKGEASSSPYYLAVFLPLVPAAADLLPIL